MNDHSSPLTSPETRRLTQPSFSSKERSSLSKQPFAGRILLTGIWGVFHFLACFLLQVCELFAPLALILGFGWTFLPHLIGVVNQNVVTTSSDPQTKELINHITQSLPTRLDIMGHTLTAHGLIIDGFLLMALAALCATIATWLGRRL
ncbi:hypothetical protein GT348_05770 [Aristophania vespae]|uniref:Uncharacterized protein n=1 Tax=Aristophania vespae TaxID=2697033 RepID=A0A6P1NED0_9PROT|nr:hypothetical protein [Aristophania vespae]QHI95818.1 hypothetical protein GT348_05770 [Aristophania vespae]UMM63530.1 hypothetical protein DM15PD_05040 [Aristophania vespae]